MSKNKRIWQLDYIKAVAVLMVVLTHCTFTAAERNRPVFVFLINMAVPLFMLVYGYVRAFSIGKKRNFSTFFKTVYGILVPATVAYALELGLIYFFYDAFPKDYLRTLFESGGIGPGSYYVPLLLQLLIVYPIIEYFFKKNSFLTSLSMALFAVVYEILADRYIDDKMYRMLCFRYIIFIIAGMNMCKYRENMMKWKNKIFALSSLSLIWLYFIVYRTYIPPVFTRWTTTAFPVVFLAMSLMIFMLLYAKPLNGVLGKVVSEIGQSSYYIFLTQLVWFGVPLAPQDLPRFPTIAVNFIFIVSFGIIFKRVERAMYKKLFLKK